MTANYAGQHSERGKNSGGGSRCCFCYWCCGRGCVDVGVGVGAECMYVYTYIHYKVDVERVGVRMGSSDGFGA